MASDPAQGKIMHLMEPNLVSSSTDGFRNAVGGYFTGEGLEFKNFKEDNNENKWIYSVISFSDPAAIDIPNYKEDTIIPYFKFVCAVDGDPRTVEGDKYWRALWLGQAIDGVATMPLYTAGIYGDHYTQITLPYPGKEKQFLVNPAVVENYIHITCSYNDYLSRYQAYAGGSESERLLPNIYLINFAKNLGTTDPLSAADSLLTRVYNYLSIDGVVPEPWLSFDDKENLDLYLDYTLPISPLQDSTKQFMTERLENVFFNQRAATQGYFDETAESGSLFPFGCSIEFKTPATGRKNMWGNIIKDAEYSSRLLRTLKEIFLIQTPTEISPTGHSFRKHISYLSASVDSLSDTTIEESETVTYNSIDFFDMLLYSYGSIKNKYEDFIIIDDKDPHTMATYDTKGVYRHINTAATMEVVDRTLDYLNNHKGFSPPNINQLLNLAPAYPIVEGHPDVVAEIIAASKTTLDAAAPDAKYSEAIAYRIEKRMVEGVPGQFIETPLQNFWFFSNDLEEVNFFDTQVKYDKNYTYNVYAYVLVEGIKYKFSDLQLSRIIGEPADPWTMVPGTTIKPISTSLTPISPVVALTAQKKYCIEYYDPASDETVHDLLEGTAYNSGSLLIASTATEAQRIAGTRIAALAGEADMPPYFANFAITVEPSLKIIECPIFSKTIKVLDNPPNRLNLLPSYTLDNSNRLSFEAHYEAFFPMRYPNPISAQDKLVKQDYLHAHDLIEDSEIVFETISEQNTIEIYRSDKKPTSFEDFDGSFIKSVSLDIPDQNLEGAYTSKQFYDKVKSNKKYYYLFRVVNEVGMPGYVDEILEAELVNDGGYKYALFNTLFKEDIKVKQYSTTTKQVKKILQLKPTFQQTVLDTTNVDFSQTALSQIDNIVIGNAAKLLWGKTFKLRLTSKKTGRKIDLNVTYNKNSSTLSSE